MVLSLSLKSSLSINIEIELPEDELEGERGNIGKDSCSELILGEERGFE